MWSEHLKFRAMALSPFYNRTHEQHENDATSDNDAQGHKIFSGTKAVSNHTKIHKHELDVGGHCLGSLRIWICSD
jgi:hypothetical protein